MAKAPKKATPTLYPIDINAVKKLLKALRMKETDRELKKAIECLECIFNNIYGNVLVCKFSKQDFGPGQPCCGMCEQSRD